MYSAYIFSFISDAELLLSDIGEMANMGEIYREECICG
ncbi:hypothetical protein SAMN02787142_5400 [Burkholderia sp. WP9]|jgi:hypothetical protein|nr:hypothetical protein SAMN02787142_5400 [Burkholderia sp. WP9]